MKQRILSLVLLAVVIAAVSGASARLNHAEDSAPKYRRAYSRQVFRDPLLAKSPTQLLISDRI